MILREQPSLERQQLLEAIEKVVAGGIVLATAQGI